VAALRLTCARFPARTPGPRATNIRSAGPGRKAPLLPTFPLNPRIQGPPGPLLPALTGRDELMGSVGCRPQTDHKGSEIVGSCPTLLGPKRLVLAGSSGKRAAVKTNLEALCKQGVAGAHCPAALTDVPNQVTGAEERYFPRGSESGTPIAKIGQFAGMAGRQPEASPTPPVLMARSWGAFGKVPQDRRGCPTARL
jgi:hypothetical protein